MRLFLVILLAAFTSLCYADTVPPRKQSMDLKKEMNDISSQRAEVDSMNERLNKSIMESISKTDSVLRAKDLERMTEQSANYFSQLSRENERLQKRKMWMYLGLGAFFLVVLIVGLSRKAKK